jgi:ATP-dependent Clp protease adaptor protein ClpS
MIYNSYIYYMEDLATHKLVLHNDDRNSFLYVIACLIRFCEHQPVQAEQCALIVHRNGNCTVKSGSYIDMLEISESLSKLDLKVSIKEYESNMRG